MNYETLITIEPGKRSGKPCIRGLRITVYDVLEYLASGMTPDEVVADFPELTLEEFAAKNGFVIVSKDSDFHQRSILYGHPPKLVYLRIGNCPTSHVSSLLWASSSKLKVFEADADASIIVLT